MSDQEKAVAVSANRSEPNQLTHVRGRKLDPSVARRLSIDPEALVDQKTSQFGTYNLMLANGQIGFTLHNAEFVAIRNGDAVTAYLAATCTTVWGSTRTWNANLGVNMIVLLADKNKQQLQKQWWCLFYTTCDEVNAPFAGQAALDLTTYEAAEHAAPSNDDFSPFYKC